MGLFSSKTEHVYSCFATKLYEKMPPVIQQTAIRAITGNRNISKDLATNISSGVLFNVNQLYNYGLKGGYHWGLPTGYKAYLPPSAYQDVENVITSELGRPIYLNSLVLVPDGSGNYIYKCEYYILNDDTHKITGNPLIWEYNEGTNRYPTLTIPKHPEKGSPYYPIIPIRVNNKTLIGKDNPYEHRQDIKRALRYLSIDEYDLARSIESQVEDSGDNPPENIHVVLGIPVAADNQESLNYLFRFFDKLYSESHIKKEDYEYWKSNGKESSSPPSNSVDISDASFKSTLAWDYITKEVVNKEGKKNRYWSTYHKNTHRDEVNNQYYSTSSVAYYYQINENQYIKVYVHGLVYKTYAANSKYVAVDCYDAFEEPHDSETGATFIVPLRKDICKEMGPVKAHDCIYDAIRLYVTDHHSYKVKWYQTGFGKFFLMVVIIVVTVVFQQYQLVGSLSALSAAVIVPLVIKTLIITMITQQIMTILAEDVLGEELALLINVILVLYGVGPTGATGITTASMVSATMTAYQGINTINFNKEMELKQDEAEEIQLLSDELYEEEMERALDVATTSNLISNDTFNTMQPSNFLISKMNEHRKPMFLPDMVHEHVNIQTTLDNMPDSMINLSVY